MSAMLIEHPEKFSQLGFIHLRCAQKQFERGEQVDRAQRDFHREIPIHAPPNRILFPPACELAKKLSAESLIISDRVCTPQSDELCHPIQLPHHPRVRAVVSDQIDIRMMSEGPVITGERIEIPINLSRAETLIAEAEQRPAMLVSYELGLGNQFRRLVRKKLLLQGRCLFSAGGETRKEFRR